VVVTEAEPASVGAWSEGCSAEIHSMGCQDFVSDFLTWIDNETKEVVLLSGIESYEQLAPNRWRWKIRPGVKFHNGAPFNAAAAKFGIDYNGVPSNVSAAVTWLGPDVTGEVVDELTFDLVCPQACPIAPRAGIFTDFQDPEWFQSASEAERSGMTMGFGPYKIINYQPGVHTKFEAYADYLPNEAFAAQAPTIQFITHTYRAEATVRASMVAAGGADWVANIGFEEEGNVPVVGMTGIESWEQLEPNRWRFKLREGVKFHNGAPWNAEQAKFWIDYFGDEATSGHHNSNDFSFHGVISGEVVDPLTLDVVCIEGGLSYPASHHHLHQVSGCGVVPAGYRSGYRADDRRPGPLQGCGVA
jgi:ABC-type transport system substrate-binding protein